MSLNDDLAAQSIERTLQLLRYGANVGKDAAKEITKLERELIKQLPDITEAKGVRKVNALMKELKQLISSTYTDVDAIVMGELEQLAKLEADWQAGAINSGIGVDVITNIPTVDQAAAIAGDAMIKGATVSEYWARQSIDTQNRFSDAVRTGLNNSETVTQIGKRVSEALGISRREGFVLGKTSAQAVAMAARDSVYKANADIIKGKVSIATLDSHTSILCATYDGAQYDLDNKPISGTTLPFIDIPRHFNCRSSWSPVTKSFAEMGLPFDDFKPSTRASMDGQISAGTTFSDFLALKPKSWQDEYLGKGRADLYRNGKITLSDLVSGTGRELTLEQLRNL